MASNSARTTIQKLYIAYYGRSADLGGQNYWADRLDTAYGSLSGIIEAFSTGDEARSLYGSGTTTADRVATLYQNILGRSPDPVGLNFYTNQVNSGKTTLGNLALDILNGVQPGSADAALIDNRLTVADHFTVQDSLSAPPDLSMDINAAFTAGAAISRSFIKTVTSDPISVTTANNQLAAWLNTIRVAYKQPAKFMPLISNGLLTNNAIVREDLTEANLDAAIQSLASDNQVPTLNGLPDSAQIVTAGVATALADFTVSDANGDVLTVTLTPTNGTINNLTDTNANAAGIQLTGTAASINAALVGATFTATQAGAANIAISVTDSKVDSPITASYVLSAQAATPVQLPTITDLAITSATGVQNSTLNVGDVVRITVLMNKATLVTGVPRLALDIGGSTVQANYASGSGTSALVFSYAIQAGQTDVDGISINANSLTLNGGTLKDAEDNPAALTHAAISNNADYKVDTIVPTVRLSSLPSSTVKLEPIGVTNGGDSGARITALSPSGEFAVTWYGNDGDSSGDTSIFVQKFNQNGSTTGNRLVKLEAIGRTIGGNQNPQIVALGNSGEFTVTWDGIDRAGDRSIFVQKFNADSTTTGNITMQLEAIDNLNGGDFNPQITAIGDNGEFVVSWEGREAAPSGSYDGFGDYSIFVQKFNANGSTTGNPPVKLEAIGRTSGFDLDPQITAVGIDGEFVVTWRGEDTTGDSSIFVQKFNANGNTTGNPMVLLEPFNVTNKQDSSPQITAVGSSGEFIVTWSGSDSEGDSSIFVQKFNADGTKIASIPVQLEAIGRIDGYDFSPEITSVGNSGEFVVTWYGGDSEGDYSIFVQKFNANGSTAGNPMVKLEPIGVTTKSDLSPQITAVGVYGDFIVTWSGEDGRKVDAPPPTGDDGFPISYSSIFVQKFNANGDVVENPTQLNNNGNYNGFPDISAVGRDGEFVVTWSGSDDDGDTSIFVQKFDAAAQPVTGAAQVSPGTPVLVRSSEIGTAYLVKSTITVNALGNITGAADAQWNQVLLTAANTDTALPTTGLEVGTYRLYTADAAGNLSVAAADLVEIVGASPV